MIMNNLKTYWQSSGSILRGLLLTFTLIAPIQSAPTSSQPWTSIGSTGAIQLGTYSNSGASMFLSSPSGILRYNVVAVDGLLDTDGPLAFPGRAYIRALFRDPSAASRVTVNLRRTRISDGFTANVAGLFIDSNSYPVSSGFQTRQVRVCGDVPPFDFVNYVYYVEVIMTRASGDISPAISAIQIGYDDAPCLPDDFLPTAP
jgi:hypothetical protein